MQVRTKAVVVRFRVSCPKIGINIAKKHVKPNPNAGVAGGIVEQEMPIHVSNVMLYNSETGKGDRVGYRWVGEGDARQKERYFKSTDKAVEV